MSQPSACLCTLNTARWDFCVILCNHEHTRLLPSADLAAGCDTLQTSSDFSGFVTVQEEWTDEPAPMKLHVDQVSASSHAERQQGQFMFISGLFRNWLQD